MATRPNLSIAPNQWHDLNALLTAQSGFPAVSVGAVLNVKLEGGVPVRICEKATQPTASDGYRTLCDIDNPVSVTNDVGTWVFCIATQAVINVEV